MQRFCRSCQYRQECYIPVPVHVLQVPLRTYYTDAYKTYRLLKYYKPVRFNYGTGTPVHIAVLIADVLSLVITGTNCLTFHD